MCKFMAFNLLFLFLYVFTAVPLHAAEDAKIIRLQNEVKKLESDLNSLKRYVPANIRTQNFLICYVHCVKMAPVTCRVQMSVFRKKTIPGGTYFIDCGDTGKKCNYPGYPSNLESARRKHRGCVHYDKNGYWFITYICDKHRFKWTFDLVNKYKALNDQYIEFDIHVGRYQTIYRQLMEKKKELNKLLPPQLDLDDEEDKDEEEQEDNFVTLHLGLSNHVIFSLKNNKLVASNGSDNVGTDKNLAAKAPKLFFRKAAGCSVINSEKKRKTWYVKKPFDLKFEAKKIVGIEVMKPAKGKVKVYELDKKNQKEAQAEKGNKIMYTDSQIGIYNSKNNVEEYRIKVHFE